MRLLNVHTFEFVETYRIPEKYAVASHRWSAGNEAMLGDIRNGYRKDTSGYKKVESFAKYIRENFRDIDLLWIDACCVNQDSDREVSEAVNSMFRWYSNAEICLAYLSDVANPRDIHQFRNSEWFSRGWTLQELLAPQTVIFLSQMWEAIGHKGPNKTRSGSALCYGNWPIEDKVAEITNIPQPVLCGTSTIASYDINTRLVWIEGRETTREEDMIYSMFGIFDVVLPVMYGETAERARRRLMNEIASNEAQQTAHVGSNTPADYRHKPSSGSYGGGARTQNPNSNLFRPTHEGAPPAGQPRIPPPSVGRPGPHVPEGWQAIWNAHSSDWYYVNIHTNQSQCAQPTEPVYAGYTERATGHGTPLSQRYAQPPPQRYETPQCRGAQPIGPQWLVTPGEKARYDRYFSEIVQHGSGVISGDQAVKVFSDSGLKEDTLASIWDLADINSEGQLNPDTFAVAMYLIREQRAPDPPPLPAFLPPRLIPPSYDQDNSVKTGPAMSSNNPLRAELRREEQGHSAKLHQLLASDGKYPPESHGNAGLGYGGVPHNAQAYGQFYGSQAHPSPYGGGYGSHLSPKTINGGLG